MEDAVRRHDDIVRAAIQTHGGYVFKTIGDAFCAAFHRPENAVAAMLAAQRALAAADFSSVDGIRVRAAIHVGTADERDGDYFGQAVNRVARLLAIGHGGQVLLSATTVDLLGSGLAHAAGVRDLGVHRLRDLEHPEHVYQLTAPDLRAEFPPLTSHGVPRNNLPPGLAPFVGRESEMEEIISLLGGHRVVTLAGTGGLGKTRTSVQVGARMLDRFEDGVWFVEFAPIAEDRYLPFTIAKATQSELAPEGDPVESLVRNLRDKHTFLILDNCEHLVEGIGMLAASIVGQCPNVTLLASSRQALGISGEITYRMPSLPVPKATARVTAADASRFAGLALFVQRASAVDSRFALTDENAPFVADLCRRLDGIPLAIELAAARVKTLSPRQLRDHLNERFRILTAGSRNVLPRHRTLHALIDWSYDLLTGEERAVFRRLGIFVNGFTLEGAQAVACGGDIDGLDVIDLLDSLVDKSLVVSEPAGDSFRYRLLESTREYALERLSEAGEREQAARRHLEFFATSFWQLQERDEQTGGGGLRSVLLKAEIEDVRSALDGALERGDLEQGGRLAAATGQVWQRLQLHREALARFDAFIQALDESEAAIRARLLSACSTLEFNQKRYDLAAHHIERALEYARASGDAALLALTLGLYVSSMSVANRMEDASQALEQLRGIKNLSVGVRLHALQAEGIFLDATGDYEGALRVQEALRAEALACGNVRTASYASINATEAHRALGNIARAIELTHEVLPWCRSEGGDVHLLTHALSNLIEFCMQLDDVSGARSAAREVIDVVPERDSRFVVSSVEALALGIAIDGDVTAAARLAGYTAAAHRREGTERASYGGRLETMLRERLAPAELDPLLAQGAALSPDAAIALALESSPES